MRIVEINAFNIGSTGNIMMQLKKNAESFGHTVICFIPAERINLKNKKEGQYIIGNILTRQLHLKMAEITGMLDCYSQITTLLLIQKLEKINPDIIHLHNLHNCYINLSMLFSYIKRKNIKIVWTLHDCWAFTGRCPHFIINNCYKWEIGCYDCNFPRNDYPRSNVDKSNYLWKKKKLLFTGIRNMIIVTPSEWLKNMVNASFLNEYEVRVINNGINLSIFKPTSSDFRAKNGISATDTMILGVAYNWNYKKGLDVFINLANELGHEYKIVLVGTDNNIDHKLPNNIISIHRTENKVELAKIYSAANVFVNPSREDVLGLVNIEAQACGTPVITFDTGGCPECLSDNSGFIVRNNDYRLLKKAIIEKHYLIDEKEHVKICVEQSKKFDESLKYLEYIRLYEDLSQGQCHE